MDNKRDLLATYMRRLLGQFARERKETKRTSQALEALDNLEAGLSARERKEFERLLDESERRHRPGRGVSEEADDYFFYLVGCRALAMEPLDRQNFEARYLLYCRLHDALKAFFENDPETLQKQWGREEFDGIFALAENLTGYLEEIRSVGDAVAAGRWRGFGGEDPGSGTAGVPVLPVWPPPMLVGSAARPFPPEEDYRNYPTAGDRE